MKRLILMIIPALICGAMFTGCDSKIATDDNPDVVANSIDEDVDATGEPYIVTFEELKGTQWKLYSIDHNTRGRIELEPKDCETCYTFTFDKDETEWQFSGVSIHNSFNIKMKFNGFNHYLEVLVTGEDEPFDGNLFCNVIKLVEITACDGRYFYLHFNECGGHAFGHGNCNGTMLFKRIIQ